MNSTLAPFKLENEYSGWIKIHVRRYKFIFYMDRIIKTAYFFYE